MRISPKTIFGFTPLATILLVLMTRSFTDWEMPVPFLSLYAAVICAAVTGSALSGALAGGLAALFVLHSHIVGFGPQLLTGKLSTSLLGMSIFAVSGAVFGWFKQNYDNALAEVLNRRRKLQEELDTERREKEMSMGEHLAREALLDSAVRIAGLGYFVFDTATSDCEFCSGQHAGHFGLTFSEFFEQTKGEFPSLDFIHPGDRDWVRSEIARIKRGESIQIEYRGLHKNGEEVRIRESVEPVFDANGKLIKEIGTSLDVTEMRRTEAHMRENQKLEAIGSLTAGVAHDFNNLLAVIMGNLELMDPVQDPSERKLLVEAALDATRRGAVLTDRLLSFGRKAMLSPEPHDLSEIIADMGTLLRRTLPATIELELPKPRQDCWAVLDGAQFENAVLNLAVNARDAMPSGGKLRIEFEEAEFDDDAIRRHGLTLEPGRYIALTVTDTGSGMTDDVRSRATEPFFSTKGVGKGSGLGLSMVLGFARQSGGDVRISAGSDSGTTVTMFFRAGRPPARIEPVATHGTEPVAGNGALVLLVEDDPQVRKMTARQLASLGYRVVEAAEGSAALSLLQQSPDVSLMLTDVVMPGELQGPDLARKVFELRPDLKVVLMSGYHPDAAYSEHQSDRSIPHLTKPIRLAELGRCLADVTGPDRLTH